MATIVGDPVLNRFRAALDAIYGDRLARVVLFGSRARGDARPDSDYDVAVFLYGAFDYWAEIERMADVTVDILFDHGAVVSAKPVALDAMAEPSSFMAEILRDGVEI